MIYGVQIDLRPICESDTENIVKWRNNPAVQQNFIFRERMTPEIHNKWLHEKVDTGEVAQFIIREHETLKEIGSVYIRDIDLDKKSGEFGIFIGDDAARGKGYGREATLLISKYAKEFGLEILFLRVIKYNLQAIKSYESTGFVAYASQKQITSDGKEIDVQLMRKDL